MRADYYAADTENGDHVDDPSEGALVTLLGDLARDGNAFLTVNPADGSAWSVVVTLLDVGFYAVERRDPERGQHELAAAGDVETIARDLTVWLADRDYRGRAER